jgi:aspartate-semialdehyde dehydrogenase
MTEKDRPQPRRDVERENGMAVFVGRLRRCPVLHYKFTALGHNTVRGAAGAAVLNAELMKVEGWLDSSETIAHNAAGRDSSHDLASAPRAVRS